MQVFIGHETLDLLLVRVYDAQVRKGTNIAGT